MRTIWLTLAWKEWHEHKWKLASLVAILWGISTATMLNIGRDLGEGALVAVRVVLLMCIVPLAIFVGLGTAAGERSRGTMSFLQALPVPMWRVALNKAFFGLATIVGATLLALAFVYVWCTVQGFMGTDYRFVFRPDSQDPFSFGIRNWFADSALAILCIAFSFYIWTVACGVNRKDDVSAGAVSLLVMVIWTVLIAYSAYWILGPRQPHVAGHAGELAVMALSTAPGGVMFLAQSDPWNQTGVFLTLGILAAFVTHFALAVWYVGRFGRITNREVVSPQMAKRIENQIDWLGPPRSSAFVSVAWKQLRESGAIVVVGLAGIIGIAAAAQLTEWWETDRPIMHVGEIYNAIAVVLGFVMAMVIGIGICLYDVQPQLNTFWRSRPIHPDLWFWCKYVTGLAVLLTAIYAPMLLIWALGDDSGMRELKSGHAYALPIAHVAVFSSAVAMTCLVRNAIYAAILSVAFLYLGVLLALAAWYVSALAGGAYPNPRIWWEPTLMQGTTGLITSVVMSSLIAWLAMRYDWGRKSRY